MKSCPQCSGAYPDEYAICPRDGTKLLSESPWEPHSVVRAKYKILDKIGEGGMATVYKAHHRLLDELRALKVIKLELSRDEQFVQRFKNEAIHTRKLNHPNAVRVDDLDIAEDGRPFMAMELVEGESLKSLMARSGPLPAGQVLEIALQVCEGLQAAHALGLVHRDIKPENIILIPRPDSVPLVKILDFGIARLKEASVDATRAAATLTSTGVVIGTPDYMSPEQAMGRRGDEIDGRSDLYSLGIVMYRMLTGELPFKADTTVEMILHHIQTVPKPPQVLKPNLHIPSQVSGIVMKALEKNRERRFASAAAMAEVIRKVQQGATLVTRAAPAGATKAVGEAGTIPPTLSGEARASAPPGTPARAPVEPATERRRPARHAALFIAALVVVLLAFAVRRRQRADDSQPPPSQPAAAPATPASGEVPQTVQPSKPFSAAPPEISEPEAPNPPEREESAGGSPASLSSPSDIERDPPAAVPNPVPDSGPYDYRPPRERSLGARSGGFPSEQRAQRVRQLNDFADRLFAQGKYPRAARLYRQILEFEPNDRRAQDGLEKCLLMMRERHFGASRR